MAAKKSNTNNDNDPWYKDGLKFSCSGCGDCCTGDPGFVWINQNELEAMAAIVNLEPDDFEYQYVRKIGARRSLKEFPNGDCVFFDTEKRNCQVYEGRPRQCRTWPFWDSNLETPEEWERTCEECPGSGKGKLHQLDHIEKQRQEFEV